VDSAVEFQGLVLGHLDSLYNYALVLTRRTEDAEDLLQEVLVRGFQSFATYDRSLSFKGWMFTIMHGSVLAMLLAWSPRVLYGTYAAVPRVTTLTPLEDQALGGVIMWAGSSTVDMLAVLALVWQLLAALERPAGAAPAELGAK
jgi:DNA-directed RNA polymerase specialized sigma24 family protein